MVITFLGTGTSHGVPMIGCQCAVCQSVSAKDKRLRSAIMVEENNRRLVIDTGPDFRAQMLREKVTHLDAVLFTHEHKDHTAGFDDVRAFNAAGPLPVYATERVAAGIRKSFDYIFEKHKYPGIPNVDLHIIDNKPFQAAGMEIIPFEVMHYHLPVTGFRIGNLVYITDASSIPKEEFEKISNSKILIINALRIKPHISHFSLSEAIATAQSLKAEKVYFLHISHDLGLHNEVEKILPPAMHLAYDRLKINC